VTQDLLPARRDCHHRRLLAGVVGWVVSVFLYVLTVLNRLGALLQLFVALVLNSNDAFDRLSHLLLCQYLFL